MKNKTFIFFNMQEIIMFKLVCYVNLCYIINILNISVVKKYERRKHEQ